MARDDFTFARMLGMVGHRTIAASLYLVDLTLFIVRALRSLTQRPQRFNRASRATIISQVIFGGVDALPAITLLGLLVGLVVTAQMILTVQVIASDADVMNLLVNMVAMELGSLLTAFVVIGRSGSAIAVDIGNMSLRREIEGLVRLGIDTDLFFVAPRLLGLAVSQLVLATYFSTIALVSGVVFSALLESVGNFRYLLELDLFFEPLMLLSFVIKNLMFGMVIAATACFHGLGVGISVTEVPQATQRAIVNALVIVLLIDGFINLVMLW